jgi:hypothetical protein
VDLRPVVWGNACPLQSREPVMQKRQKADVKITKMCLRWGFHRHPAIVRRNHHVFYLSEKVIKISLIKISPNMAQDLKNIGPNMWSSF